MPASSTDPPIFDVVVTRDAGRLGELATQVAGQGARVVALPLTQAAPPPPAAWATLVARAAAIATYDTIVVVSATGAAALARALAEAGTSPPAAARVVAVGGATAAALVAAGVAATARVERPAHGDAAGVADHLLAGPPPRRVLWPRAAGGRDDGIARLRGAGVEVDAPTAYQTVATTVDDPALADGLGLIAAGRAAVVCVYAPSQAAALQALLDAHGAGLAALAAARVVAIGDTTAAALRGRGVRVDAVAATPDASGMARAIAAVYPRNR